MNINYYFEELSRSEKEFIEAVMMEEIEIQVWFSISYSTMLGHEVFMTLQ